MEKDYLGDVAASKALAYNIRKYWTDRGYNPNVEVYPFKESENGPTLRGIRSDINPNWAWTPILKNGVVDVR